MAPKGRISKKRSRDEENRKKKKMVHPSSSSPMGKTPFSSRSVSLGRNIDFPFLEEEGFTIGKKLINLGWESFCSLSLESAIDLVREFYYNFQSSFNLITSMVKGVEIQITTSVLTTILDLPIVSYVDESSTDRKTKLELILDKEEVGPLDKIELKDLSVEKRVLHHIACKIICPRAGRYDYVSEQDVSIMYHILAELPLNLPALIMDTMCDAVKRTKAILPYGMLLTKIFQTYGVDLENETLSPLLHTDTFNIHTFRRMGFLKVNEIWTTREDRALGIPEGEEEDVRPPPSSPIHSAEEPMFQTSSAPAPEFHFAPSSSMHQTMEFRLPDDQLRQLAIQVADMLRGSSSSGSRSDEQGLVPHSSQISSSLTEIQRRLDIIEYEIVRIRARVSGLESQIERITLPSRPTLDQITEISELSTEAARLRGIVLEGLKQMKDTSQSNYVLHNLQELKNSLDLLRATIMSTPSIPSEGSSRRRRRRRQSSSEEDED